MSRNARLIAAGFSLTALAYGLARFAFGLLLPRIREELSFGASTAGWIGGSAFAAYCAGIVVTFYCAGKLGPRALALSAGLAATAGMGLVAMASSAPALGVGIALAGLSTGLTSPPLATAVANRISERERPRANAIINAGTAAGIVFAGAATLMVAEAWRQIYVVFVLVGGAITAWVWFAMPAHPGTGATQGLSFAMLGRPGVPALCAGAFMMGISSTAVWTFGADIVRRESTLADAHIGWIWIALGTAGSAGALTGTLTGRFGTERIRMFSLFGMAAGVLGLGGASISPVYCFAAVTVFGASYIVASGTYLIQGIALLAQRPDLGLGIPFLALALGQTAGNPLFGTMLDKLGLGSALIAFAGAACVAVCIRPRRPSR